MSQWKMKWIMEIHEVRPQFFSKVLQYSNAQEGGVLEQWGKILLNVLPFGRWSPVLGNDFCIILPILL